METITVKELEENYNLIIHTETEWESQNPILEKGVLGYSSDGLLLKIGNGYDTWTELLPANGGNGIEEVPNDNVSYVRMNKKWCPLIEGVASYPVPSLLYNKDN